MMVAIIILVIAYIIALLGLFHRSENRRLDGLGLTLGVLLTVGLVAGVAKEVITARAEYKAKEDRRSVEAQRQDQEDARNRYDKEQQKLINSLLTRVTELINQLKANTTSPEVKANLEAEKTAAKNSVSTVKVVTIHVGGDESKSGTFNYVAPSGYIIKDFKLRERSKGGDAHYSPSLVSPTNLQVKWSVKSSTIRGPFKMLLNTITAFLDLDAEITLQESPNHTESPAASNPP